MLMDFDKLILPKGISTISTSSGGKRRRNKSRKYRSRRHKKSNKSRSRRHH